MNTVTSRENCRIPPSFMVADGMGGGQMAETSRAARRWVDLRVLAAISPVNSGRRLTGMLSIEKWESDALPPLGGLVAESAAQGFAMLRRLVDDWDSRANRFDQAGETLFLASAEEMVVGVCGLNVDPYAADPSIGRLRHLFVMQAFRRRGIGRALVQRAIDHASSHFRAVRLRTYTHEADAFYRSIGFAALPDESSATHVLKLEVHPS